LSFWHPIVLCGVISANPNLLGLPQKVPQTFGPCRAPSTTTFVAAGFTLKQATVGGADKVFAWDIFYLKQHNDFGESHFF
jgi:hypothetical protein